MVRYSLALCAAGLLCAAEHAVLHSGAVILAERHEVDGATIRLHTTTGVIELPAAAIAEFEAVVEEPKPAPEPPRVAPAVPPEPLKPRELVEQAAHRNGLPPELLHSVARVESAYRPDAVSPKGAIGIMQLMPGTAALLKANPHDPEQNVEAGARHLRELLIRYNGETMKALAAYNAGEGAVSRYNGVPPYAETRDYVEKVLRNYWRLAGQASDNGAARQTP
jgi:soluble lytic murein transglycosylase-like protein